MKALAYDLFMLLGAGLITGGVAVSFGLGPSLITGGVLVMGMTYTGARR